MQPPLTKDYFSLFGLPIDFHIDDEELTARYREMQSAVHPDRYASAAAQEQRISLQMAARINEAYETLRHPMSRIRYMLELKGVDPRQADSSPDPAFLARQIEWRETLEEIRESGDPGHGLAALSEEAGACIATLLEKVAAELKDDARLSSALTHFLELQYYYRLLEEARDIEDMLEQGGPGRT